MWTGLWLQADIRSMNRVMNTCQNTWISFGYCQGGDFIRLLPKLIHADANLFKDEG
jgi:hypothetical protein